MKITSPKYSRDKAAVEDDGFPHFIRVQGARQNNLKNLSLDIPLEKIVCITGPSGSGKSSLAFDTLYAEGHRRYVESLSTYTRQFFERVPKPDVDRIENISPAIALQQKNSIKNSRSTVGTSTEIYDYLRLMYSKIGTAYCPNGHGAIASDTPQTAADRVLSEVSGSNDRAYLGFFLPESILANQLIERGFLRKLKSLPKNSGVAEVEELESFRDQKLDRGAAIVLDRLVVSLSDRFRLIESFEASFRQGGGQAFIYLIESKKVFRFRSNFSCAECGQSIAKKDPLLFSFNSPLGACANCKGFGNTLEYDESLLVPSPRLTLEKGAVEPFTKKMMSREKRRLWDFIKAESIPLNVPWNELDSKIRAQILNGKGKYTGVVGSFKKFEAKRYKLHVRVFLRRYQTSVTCEVCSGSRLKSDALWIKIADKHIYDLTQFSLGALELWFQNLKLSSFEAKIVHEVLSQIKSRLRFLNRMGLHYLSLHRLSKTLSGGESQRIALANQLGAELSGTLYVLDEPSVGLHSMDRDRLLDSLDELAERGNSVVVVEHDLDTIARANHVIELGPESGQKGGQIVFQGDIDEFKQAKTLTADYLRSERRIEIPKTRRDQSTHWISVQSCTENNLKNVTFKIPLNRLVGVSGVSGSGKSTLIRQTLYNALARLFNQSTEKIGRFKKLFGADQIKGVMLLDQSPIGKTTRSIPLSVIGGYDEVRRLFADTVDAKNRGLTPSSFSFNVPGGRCETCAGEGVVRTEMYFLDDLFLTCDDCQGRRFRKETLGAKYRSRSIHEVLQMTVREAKVFFAGQKNLCARLQLLEDVGLGYITLGQGSQTLSGGEAQRLRIASEISNVKRNRFLYILDEPTTGLHISEIELLLKLLQGLVEAGNTVLVIEHQMDVLKSVDWLIDLGPGAGEEGGSIVGEGVPEMIAKLKTPTGQAMKKSLAI